MTERQKVEMQPIVLVDGVLRFQKNRIVEDLLHAAYSVLDPNRIARRVSEGMYSKEEYEQFNQLIGYSVSGFGELSLVRPEAVAEADRRVEQLRTDTQDTVRKDMSGHDAKYNLAELDNALRNLIRAQDAVQKAESLVSTGKSFGVHLAQALGYTAFAVISLIRADRSGDGSSVLWSFLEPLFKRNKE